MKRAIDACTTLALDRFRLISGGVIAWLPLAEWRFGNDRSDGGPNEFQKCSPFLSLAVVADQIVESPDPCLLLAVLFPALLPTTLDFLSP